MRRHRRPHLTGLDRGGRIGARQLAEARLETGLGRVPLCLQELRIARAVQLGPDIDMRLERERRVEHRLDLLDAVRLDRELDAVRMRRGGLDDVAAGHGVEAREQLVVLAEIGVA